MTIALLLLLCVIPRDLVARESVDLLETNWFYDEQGKIVFVQNIAYDWSHEDGRYQVRAWRLVRGKEIPQRDWQHGGYVLTWQDSELMRVVHAPAWCETHTQYDRELAERDMLPKERRKELATIRLRPRPNWSSMPPPDVLQTLIEHHAEAEGPP